MNGFRLSRLAGGAALVGVGGALLACPGLSAAGVHRGLALCGDTVIPSLFPYLVVTTLLLRQPGAAGLLSLPLRPLGRAMGQKSHFFAALLLLCGLGGFAPAAACIAGALRRGQITPYQGRLLCFCGLYASPAFVLGAVGPGLWPGAGPLLLGCGVGGWVSCCLAAPLFCGRGAALPGESAGSARGGGFSADAPARAEGLGVQREGAPAGFAASLEESTLVMIKICGFVVFFSFLAVLLGAFLPGGKGPFALLSALLEMTGGFAACGALGGQTALFACRATLSGLGLCALAQVRSLLPPELPFGPVVWGRLCHGAVSLGLLRLLAGRFAPAQSVYSSLAGQVLIRLEDRPR